MPTRFFLNCNDGISPAQVRSYVKKYGSDILIGIDPGLGDRPENETQDTVDAVKKAGAKLHVYLVGPGMMSWSSDEAKQIKSHAKSVGIDLSDKKWHDEWMDDPDGGWEKKVYEQFTYYNSIGAYSCEIDNLDGIWEQSQTSLIDFFIRFQNWKEKNKINTKLMIKNLSVPQLRSLVNFILVKKELKKETFAEWGMFEAGTGVPRKQIELCKSLGIQACTPISGITDTNHYGVVKDGVPSL